MFTFVGLLCVAVETPFVTSGVGSTEPMVLGNGGHTPAHSPSAWSIVDVLVICESGSAGGPIVGAVPSVDCAAVVLACETAPELPGLAMRTDTLTLEGDGCVADASVVAVAEASFVCATAPSEPGLLIRT